MSKVAIIIPFYNQTLEYISQAVDSALTQTLRDIEVILVDDGSANPLQYRKLTKDSRVKIFQSPHRGAGYARNIGILNSNSENIMFLDSDDYYPTNTVLENLYMLKNEHKVLITGGKHLVLTSEKQYLNGETFFNDSIVNYSEYEYYYSFWKYMYDSELIKENKIFFPQLLWFEDPIFFVKAMHKAGFFYGANLEVYVHRESKNIKEMSLAQARDYFRGSLILLKYAKRNKLYKLYASKREELFKSELEFFRSINGLKKEEFQEMLKLLELIDCTKLL